MKMGVSLAVSKGGLLGGSRMNPFGCTLVSKGGSVEAEPGESVGDSAGATDGDSPGVLVGVLLGAMPREFTGAMLGDSRDW